MVELNVTIDGDKVFIEGLNLADNVVAIGAEAGMERITVGVFDEAHKLLSGPSRKQLRIFTKAETYDLKTRKRTRTKLRGLTNQITAGPGNYPVPVVTGHLRGRLGYVMPGESKSADGYSFSAGALESIIYDSANYASVIRDGTLSSLKFGPRPFDTDAVKNYDRGGRILAVIEEEIQRAIDESDLG